MSQLHHFNEIIFSINSIASVQFYPIYKILLKLLQLLVWLWMGKNLHSPKCQNARSGEKNPLVSNLKKIYSGVVCSNCPFSNSSLSVSLSRVSLIVLPEGQDWELMLYIWETGTDWNDISVHWPGYRKPRAVVSQCSFHQSCNASSKHCLVSKHAESPGEVRLSEFPESLLDEWFELGLYKAN